MENLSIVGTGLMGCSIAICVKDMFSSISGYDINPKNIEYAALNGIISKSSSIKRIAYESDVIIVSVPVDASIEIIPFILNEIDENTTVIDVGSTKSQICRAIQNHPRRANFVAAHPMAGSESSGPKSSNSEIFSGRKAIICQSEKSSILALNCAKSLFTKLGMTIEYMDVETHDRLVAMVSHLPQAISYGLAKTISQSANDDDPWCGIAAGGFDSSTRLAKSSSTVWVPILLQNKAYVSECLQEFITQMELLKELIDTDDKQGIKGFIRKSQNIRKEFENSNNNKNEQKNGNKSINRSKANQFVATGIE